MKDHRSVHNESHPARVRAVPGAIDEVARQGQQTWQAVAPAWSAIATGSSTRRGRSLSVWWISSIPGRATRFSNSLQEPAKPASSSPTESAPRAGSSLLTSPRPWCRRLRAALTQRGLANVEFRVIDAQEIDLPDGSVDGVLSRFGLMLVPDPRRALEESHRVLRPGGRLAYAVWGAIDRNPWITLLAGALL